MNIINGMLFATAKQDFLPLYTQIQISWRLLKIVYKYLYKGVPVGRN